jgi:ketosteroid isomerase-like protein
VKCVWLAFVLCPIVYAVPCPSGQGKDGSALIQAEQTWAKALEQGDGAALDCILAEEFEDAGPDGSLTNRTATLEKASKPRPVHNELTELHPQVHGDFGYIRGSATATDRQGTVVARVRFTDVYVYRDGRWQCVAGHESMLAK